MKEAVISVMAQDQGPVVVLAQDLAQELVLGPVLPAQVPVLVLAQELVLGPVLPAQVREVVLDPALELVLHLTRKILTV